MSLRLAESSLQIARGKLRHLDVIVSEDGNSSMGRARASDLIREIETRLLDASGLIKLAQEPTPWRDRAQARSTACPTCGRVGASCDCVARTLSTMVAEPVPATIPFNADHQPTDEELAEAALTAALTDYPDLDL